MYRGILVLILSACSAFGQNELESYELPFGSLHTESLEPVFQTDAVYGINEQHINSGTTALGTATASDSSFVCTTGTTIYGSGFIQSKKRLRYRPGQGIIVRFAGSYTSGVADSYQVMGVGTAEDGVYFGYKDDNFGILYNERGVREVQTLTITTGSSTAENITVTLAGTANTVAVTNNASIQETVWEISQGAYSGFKAYPEDNTVVFVADSVGDKTGTFSITATTAAGTFAETKTGVAVTEQFIAQTSWNGDKLDGTGKSAVTLDPTKFNVYEIQIQYLGAGSVDFFVEVTTNDYSRSYFAKVHTINFPNTRTRSTFRQPSFPFTMSAYSAGSTTDLTLKCSSFAGFIEGRKRLHGAHFSYFGSSTTAENTAYTPLFTILNQRYWQGIANQAVVNILSVSGAVKHTRPTVFYLIRNGELEGDPDFESYDDQSCTLWDTAATAVTFSNNRQLIWSGHSGDTSSFIYHMTNSGLQEVTLQPGDYITLAVKTEANTVTSCTGSINTREDD